MKGILITFEGTDGCGKSTQIRFLKAHLEQKGHAVLVSREPGGTAAGEKIRQILLNDDHTNISPLCELFLFEAARAQHMAEVVFPALEQGKIVILDRFIDSSYAYQGIARGLGGEMVELLNNYAVSGRQPDLTLLLSLPPKAAFQRKGGRDNGDRMEQAGEEFFKKVRQGYELAAQKNPERIAVINVEGAKDQTHMKIVARVEKCLEEIQHE